MTTDESTKPTVLIGVGGGIAAYKVAEVASRLTQGGAAVHVAMTRAAQKFVGPTTFAAVTGSRVLTRMFAGRNAAPDDEVFPHLYPATGTDVFLLAPATADLIARIVHGVGDDIVTTSILSLPASCTRVFCPSMNVEMWRQPIVQENVRALEARGWVRLGPDEGQLACGMAGAGRLAEPTAIVNRVADLVANRELLRGKRFLIFSGPTREHLDPVRFLSNGSSGRMGKALAEAAAARGATVDFVTGPVANDALPRGPAIDIVAATSATEMLEAGEQRAGSADAMIFAAAVADYCPAATSDAKGAKATEGLTLELRPTPDIAAALAGGKRSGQIAVGYALETHDGAASARDKLARKNLDAIILNDIAAVDAEAAAFTFFTSATDPEGEDWGQLTKDRCAARLMDEIAAMMGAAGP